MSTMSTPTVTALPEQYFPPSQEQAMPAAFQALRRSLNRLGDPELVGWLDQAERGWKEEREKERQVRIGLYRLLFPKKAWDDFNPNDYVPFDLDEILAAVGASQKA
jgi:hypothetical protein